MSAESQRNAGQQVNGKWLVLTESQPGKGETFIHNCGETLMCIELTLSHRLNIHADIPLGDGSVQRREIPFCPKCEGEPVDGVIDDESMIKVFSRSKDGRIIVNPR